MGHQFFVGKQFCRDGRTYEVLERQSGGRLKLTDMESGALQTVSEEDLLHALFVARNLKFVLTGQAQEDDKGRDVRGLSEYPAKSVKVAFRRLEIIKPLLLLSGRKRSDAVVQARIEEARAAYGQSGSSDAAISSPSIATVRRWLRLYLKSAQDIRSLIPRTFDRGGRGASRLDPTVISALEKPLEMYKQKRERCTVVDLQHLLAYELEILNRGRSPETQLRVPAVSTIWNHVRRLDVMEVLTARHGAREAKRAFKQVRARAPESEPLARVEIDHHTTDLLVFDETDDLVLGRLTLTYAHDCATRYPLGFYLGFEPPSLLTVQGCLRHAVMPKPDVQAQYGTAHPWLAYGLPGNVIVDNGLEFVGTNFPIIASALGFSLTYAPVRTPEFKGGVERFFRTQGQGLFHTLPGTTFSNPTARGRYDSAKEACVGLGAIDRLWHLYLLDVYAECHHRGLGGVPARVWERATERGFLPTLPESARELDILLGETTSRQVWHYGVDWDNLRYQSHKLATLRVRLKNVPTEIKRSRGDLGRIFVHDPFEKRWLEVPVVEEAHTYAHDLSVWKHRVISRFVRNQGDRIDLAALGQAKQQIQNIVQESRAGRVGVQRKLARWETGGKPVSQLANPPSTLEHPQLTSGPQTSTDAKSGRAQVQITGFPEADSPGWELIDAPMPKPVYNHEEEG